MNFIKKKIKSHKKPHETDDDLYASAVTARTPKDESVGEAFEAKQDTEEWQFFQQLTQRVQDTVSKTQTALTKLKDTSAISEIDKPDYYFAEEEEASKPLPPTVKTWIQFSEDGQVLEGIQDGNDSSGDPEGAKAPPRPPPPKPVTSTSSPEHSAPEESSSLADAIPAQECGIEEPVPPLTTGDSAATVDQPNVLSLLDDFTFQPEIPKSTGTLDVSDLLSDIDEGPDPFDTSFINVEESEVTLTKLVETVVSKAPPSTSILTFPEEIPLEVTDVARSPDPFDTSFIDAGNLSSFAGVPEVNNNFEGLDPFSFDGLDLESKGTDTAKSQGLELEAFSSLSKSDTKPAESLVDKITESPEMSNPFLTDASSAPSSEFAADLFGISPGREAADAPPPFKQKASTNPFEITDSTGTSSPQDLDLLGAGFQSGSTGSALFGVTSTSPFSSETSAAPIQFDPFSSVFDQKPTENGTQADATENGDQDLFGLGSQPSSRRESAAKDITADASFDAFPAPGSRRQSTAKESLADKPFDSFSAQMRRESVAKDGLPEKPFESFQDRRRSSTKEPGKPFESFQDRRRSSVKELEKPFETFTSQSQCGSNADKVIEAFPPQDGDSKHNSLEGIQFSGADGPVKANAFTDDPFASLSEKRTSVGSVKLPPVSEVGNNFFDLMSEEDEHAEVSDSQEAPTDPFSIHASVTSPPKTQPVQTSGDLSDLNDIFGPDQPGGPTGSLELVSKEPPHTMKEDDRRDSTKSNKDLLDDFFGGATEAAVAEVDAAPHTLTEPVDHAPPIVSAAESIDASTTDSPKTDGFDPFSDMTQEPKPKEEVGVMRKPSLTSLNPFEAEQQPAPDMPKELVPASDSKPPPTEEDETVVNNLEKEKMDEPTVEETSSDIFGTTPTTTAVATEASSIFGTTTVESSGDIFGTTTEPSAEIFGTMTATTTTTTESSDNTFGAAKTGDGSFDPFNVSTVEAVLESSKSKAGETASGFLDFSAFDTPATKDAGDFSDPFVSGSMAFEPAKSSSTFTDTAAFEAFAAKFEQAIEKLDDTSKDPLQALDPFGGTDLSDAKSDQGDGRGFDTMDLFDPFAPAAKPPKNTPTRLPQKAPSQDSFDDDEGPDFSITIKPKMRDVSDTLKSDTGPPPLLPPPPKSPIPQVPASRFNPFDKDFGFSMEETAQEEPVVAEPVVVPYETEPPPALGEAATKRTESQESPSTPLFDEDTSQPLEEFPPKFEGDGWEMMLRQPNKKKITGNRFWKKVYLKVSENSILQLYNKKEDNDPFQELPLQACYSLSEIGAQQYDQYGKIFTVKLQYVFYRERVGVRPAQISKVMQGHITSVGQFAKLGLPLEHAPQVSQLLKIGTQCYADLKIFVQVVEDALFHLTVHRDRALTYKTEEVQLAVHDELYVEQNKMGHILKQLARVRVFFLAFITGMPDVEVGINDLTRQGKEVVGRHDIIPVVTEEWIRLENCEFHSCVVQEEFEKNRIIKLHPPDACFFELLRFRIRPPRNRELPLQVKAVMKIVKTRVEVRIDVLVPGYTSRKHGQVPCEDVQIRFPLPECWIYLFRVEKHFRYGSLKSAARKPGKIMGLDRIMGTAQNIETSLIEVSAGQAKYEHAFKALVWRVPRLPKEGHGAYTTQLLVMRLDLTSFDQIPNSFDQYMDVEFSMPATTVSHTTIRSVSVTSPNPPEKYVRYVAKHDYKVEIDFCFESEESEYVAAAAAAAAAAQVTSPPPSNEPATVEEENESD